jgi:hypothetical protein
MEYLRDKINEFATHSKNKNIKRHMKEEINLGWVTNLELSKG